MIEAMDGDPFLLIDQDDVLAPDFISRCAQALRNDPALWAAATWTEFLGSYEAVEAKPPFDARVAKRENPIVSTAVRRHARAAGGPPGKVPRPAVVAPLEARRRMPIATPDPAGPS